MHTSVRQCARRFAAVSVGAALALAASATPAAATATTFSVTHAASYEYAAVPRGALLAIFTVKRVSAERFREFSPWTQTTPDGLYVEASCANYDTPIRLPILFVGYSGRGSQINVYYPNSVGPEPWGTCADAGDSKIRIHPATGRGSTIQGSINTVAAHPGLFGATRNAPAGLHLDGQSGTATALSDCNAAMPADPTRCRARTNGTPAELTLYLTGADYAACGPCMPGFLAFTLARMDGGVLVGPEVTQELISVTRTNNGVEQARIRLRPDTAAGQYRIRAWSVWSGYAVQDLTVELGQPT